MIDIDNRENDCMETMKSGDVIIFEAGDNWLSKAIAKLTDSNVSHAAMRYKGDSIVEMGAGGISVSKCNIADEGDKAYLLRLFPEKDSTPLIEAAEKYIDAGTVYDYPDLVFFAGLLVYRAIRPTMRWQKVTDVVLNAACAVLDKILNRIIQQGGDTPALVCSQLVYQCYLDCGEEYKIKLKDALLQGAIHGKVVLAKLLEDRTDIEPVLYDRAQEEIDLEALAQELCVAMEEEDTVLLGENELCGTLGYAKKFLDLVEHLMKELDMDIPVPALFVAPNDLLDHAVNLKKYAEVFLMRE